MNEKPREDDVPVLAYGRSQAPQSRVPAALQMLVGFFVTAAALGLSSQLMFAIPKHRWLVISPLLALAFIAFMVRRRWGWTGFERGLALVVLLMGATGCLIAGYCFYFVSHLKL